MIIVSHRGPFGFSVDDTGELAALRGPGGLAGTLNLLATSSDALEGSKCLSAALTEGDLVAMAVDETLTGLGTDVDFVELDPEQHRLHYEVVSNEVLWFLFHGIFDLPRTPTFGRSFRDAWEAYVSVNRVFADRVLELAPPGELVLVQDYPLALVPGMLVDARPDLRLCYFAHTPFSGPGGMRMLPDDVALALSTSLAHRPCGFHTRRWADAYEGSTRAVLGPDAPIAPAFVASLGPDPDALTELAASPSVRTAAEDLDELVGDRALLFRSDRIDLTKNIVRGFQAYDELLESTPKWRERVVFVAKLNSSRATLPEYAAYRAEIDLVAARVRERWATRDWDPLVVDTGDAYERTVAGFLRYDVLLVNPIKDGLNLVAKEGPLVNTRDGVLCLSAEAGAYEELADAALRVHPYDLEQTAAALDQALSMGTDERADRAARLRATAAARTPALWLQDLVDHAR